MEKASSGDIKFKIFPAGQLGKATDHFDMAKDGVADFTWVNPGFNVGRWPVIAIGENVLLFKDPMAGGRAITNWYRANAAAKEIPGVKYCFSHTSQPNSFFSVKKPIRVPSDFKDLRVRPSNSTQGRLIKMFGGTTVFFPLTKVREPVERGIVDVVNAPPFSNKLFGGHQGINHAVKDPLTPITWFVVMNKKKYEGLSSKNRAIVDDHCTAKWSAAVTKPSMLAELGGWKWYEENGKNVYSLTEAELGEWRKASDTLLVSWKKDVAKRGLDAEDLYQNLQIELKKEGAL